MSTATSVKDCFVHQTSSFVLNASFEDRFRGEDELIRSARAFYLVIPSEALESSAWGEYNKTKRRRIIKSHLNNVCKSFSREDVVTVDCWMSNRTNQREMLSFYGKKLEDRYGKLCFLCGKKIEGTVTVDHIFPHSKGGDTSIDNLMLAHQGCNSSKGSRIPGEFYRWANTKYSEDSQDIDSSLRYLVYLRDNFTCKRDECDSGLFTGEEIDIEKIFDTGIKCYDNLKAVCMKCKSQKL